LLRQPKTEAIFNVRDSVSRKRVADALGNFPEQLATSFDENLAILHFDH